MNLLEFSGVERSYKLGTEEWKLGPLSFVIRSGESIAVTGESGSGKSTMLHLIGGMDQPTSGEITYQGKEFSKLTSPEIERYRNKEIGFIFQDFHLLPEFTLLENILMPLLITGTSRKEAAEQGMEVLRHVGLLGRQNHLPRELSGGEMQRGAIARAIVHAPKLLLADEPTGNLDVKTGNNIMELLQRLHEENAMTIIIVTHDPHIAQSMKRQIVLGDGKIVSDTKKEK